jgi:signal recognition particle subunit SRP54
MFELLTDRLNKVFKFLGNKGRLEEKDIDEALREIRLALLEADVNFKVVKDFTSRIRERAVGAGILTGLNPGQQIVKIVNEELIATLGGGQSKLVSAPHPPSIIMMVGLQGSGKTTTAAKLAYHLKHSGQKPLLVAADIHRPAAIDQLIALGKQNDLPVFSEPPSTPSKDIAAHALERARELAATWIIIDTAGRLQIDEEMMQELADVKKTVNPDEILLVVDAMTGQESVNVAAEFHKRVNVTGLILTKMDGDARGGAALSIRWVSGVPIKFMGIGEKVSAFEPFYPDRLASRILGMGDVLTFIEKVEKNIDQEKAKELEKKVKSATFDLEDFMNQLKEIKKMGPLGQLIEMLPGMSKVSGKMLDGNEDKRLKRIEAIIQSMTPAERQKPEIINGSRRRRIAEGSGTTLQEINQFLNQFQQMRKLMRSTMSGKISKSMLQNFKGLG